MQVFGFRQEKKDLAHKLKERDELLGEYGLDVDRRIRKKPRADRIIGNTSTVIEEQRIDLEEVKEEIKQKHQDYESIKVSKPNRKYKAKIKGLERQLQVNNFQFDEENTQRLGVVIQLK